jgi:hypothetical protein
MGVTASAPFNGVDDENLAIAYISMLILVFFVRPPPRACSVDNVDFPQGHSLPPRRISHHFQGL